MAPKGKGKKGKRGDDDWPSDDDKVSAASQRLQFLSRSETHPLRLRLCVQSEVSNTTKGTVEVCVLLPRVRCRRWLMKRD